MIEMGYDENHEPRYETVEPIPKVLKAAGATQVKRFATILRHQAGREQEVRMAVLFAHPRQGEFTFHHSMRLDREVDLNDWDYLADVIADRSKSVLAS